MKPFFFFIQKTEPWANVEITKKMNTLETVVIEGFMKRRQTKESMSITDVKVMTCVNQTNNVKSIFVKILLRLNTYKESKTFKRK